MGDITSKPSTPAFRANMDRIFGTGKRAPVFYKTESHCELCKMRQSGCPYQYDSEDCYEKREYCSMLGLKT